MHRRHSLAALAAAQARAWRDGEFVGQESFVPAASIDALARQAGIDASTRVLDLCCGTAGPGRYVARTFGCEVTAVDSDPGALEMAREEGVLARLVSAEVPPIPFDGPFDVVLLLETMLAFEDKSPLLAEIARVLRPGGRFAMTLEEGAPLDADERRRMPHSDTVWLIRLDDMRALLEHHGFEVAWCLDDTKFHADIAARLATAFRDDRESLAGTLGAAVTDDLIRSHELWGEWMIAGRVRKFSVVAQQGPSPRAT